MASGLKVWGKGAKNVYAKINVLFKTMFLIGKRLTSVMSRVMESEINIKDGFGTTPGCLYLLFPVLNMHAKASKLQSLRSFLNINCV